MLLTEYDEIATMNAFKAEGMAEGRAQELKQNIEKLAKNYLETGVAKTMAEARKLAKKILK